MKPYLLAGIFLLLLSRFSSAQHDTIITRYQVQDADTLAVIDLSEIPIIIPDFSVDPIESKRFSRLVKNVKKVYPYAKLAGMRFRELNDKMGASLSRKEKKRAIDAVEDEIKDRYGEELKKLSFTQGKILIKLLDRETGNSSYELVQDLKGNMLAFFYQGFARIWGYNLKTKYDPKGEDWEVEQIILLIERGEI